MIGKPEETIKLVGRVGRLEGSSDSSDDIIIPVLSSIQL